MRKRCARAREKRGVRKIISTIGAPLQNDGAPSFVSVPPCTRAAVHMCVYAAVHVFLMFRLKYVQQSGKVSTNFDIRARALFRQASPSAASGRFCGDEIESRRSPCSALPLRLCGGLFLILNYRMCFAATSSYLQGVPHVPMRWFPIRHRTGKTVSREKLGPKQRTCWVLGRRANEGTPSVQP